MNFITTWPAFNASRTTAVVVLTAVLFFTSACKRKDAEIDLPSKDQDYQIGGIYTDTITVKASTAYVRDSIVSSGSAQQFIMCGAYNDPLVGKVWTESYTQFRLTGENVDRSSAVADSAVVKLNYSYAYGDTTQDQTFEVYPLTDSLSYSNIYYTISPAKPVSAKIGEVTFKARPNSPNRYLRIPINVPYAQTVLDASNTTNALFVLNPATYGLALKPKDNDKGAVILINFTGETCLRVYYTRNSVSDSVTYSIDGNSARFFKTSFDRNGSVVAALNPPITNDTASYLIADPAATGGQLYIQSMLGLKVKISFPYLKSFLIRDDAYVSVNRAILELPILNGTNSAAYRETTAIVGVRSDAVGKVLKINRVTQLIQASYADPVGSGIAQVVFPDLTATPNTYYNLLTNYFLAIRDGKLLNRPLYFSPLYNSSEVNRAVIDPTGVKLKVYYTTIKKGIK